MDSSSSFTLPTQAPDDFLKNSGPPTVWIVFAALMGLATLAGFIGVCYCGYRRRRNVTVQTQLPDGSTVYVNVEEDYHNHHNNNHHHNWNHHHAHQVASVTVVPVASSTM